MYCAIPSRPYECNRAQYVPFCMHQKLPPGIFSAPFRASVPGVSVTCMLISRPHRRRLNLHSMGSHLLSAWWWTLHTTSGSSSYIVVSIQCVAVSSYFSEKSLNEGSFTDAHFSHDQDVQRGVLKVSSDFYRASLACCAGSMGV